MNCDSGNCIPLKRQSRRHNLSLGSWLLIALLPKCPLCILSFSSAITLCGGKTLFAETVGWTSYIPIVLALILITTFFINYKGVKTLMAIGLAICASLIILYGEYVTKTSLTYYTGVIILFFACWVNGSFQFFINKMKRRFMLAKA